MAVAEWDGTKRKRKNLIGSGNIWAGKKSDSSGRAQRKKKFQVFHKRPHSFSSSTMNVWVCVTNDRTFNSAKASAKESQIKLLHKGKKTHKTDDIQNWKLISNCTKWKELETLWKATEQNKKQRRNELNEWKNEKKRNLELCLFECNAMFGWTAIQVLHLQMWCFVTSSNWQCNRK